jgi:hypothetical protein
LLLALVLGLLVWTSYGVYSQQQSEAHTLGSQVLQLDLALERYGPAADRGRELLRQELQASRERFWGADGGSKPVRLTYGQSRAELRHFDGFFATLKPVDDEQRHQRDTARQLSASMVQTHYLMSRQLRTHSGGAAHQRRQLGRTVHLHGASSGVGAGDHAWRWAPAVASAIYLILEFSHPIWGCSGYRAGRRP